MRISDWSSDVCSSDLAVDQVVHNDGIIVAVVARRTGRGVVVVLVLALRDGRGCGDCQRKRGDREHDFLDHDVFLSIMGTARDAGRSEEHTSELQSLMRISYAVFCLKKKTLNNIRES